MTDLDRSFRRFHHAEDACSGRTLRRLASNKRTVAGSERRLADGVDDGDGDDSCREEHLILFANRFVFDGGVERRLLWAATFRV